jgi:UDP-2,3-diacylglucosamine pyrophosphatase LpxH
MTTLIISDLHLGACNSRTDLIADLLRSDFDRLIVNGDTVDRTDPRRLRDPDWRVVALLRAVARERELVVVRGNHDALPGPGNARGATHFVAELLHTPVVEEYVLEVGGSLYLVVHGDQFDATMNLTWVGDAADWCYRGIQRLSRPLAHFAKQASKHVCGVVESVQRGALAHARRRGFAGIITGHTHFHHDEWRDGLHYLNTGCWVDAPCSCVLAEDDAVRLVHWPERGAIAGPHRDRSRAPVSIPA